MTIRSKRLSRTLSGDNYFRLLILVASIATTYFVMRLWIIYTVVIFECWSISDVWLNHPSSNNPLYSYATAFGLMGLWALTECYVGVKNGLSWANTTIATMCFTAVLLIFLGLFHIWQHTQIEQGFMVKEAYFIKLADFYSPELTALEGDTLPSFAEFLKAQRCDNGLAISTMTEDESNQLLEDYWQRLQESYQRAQ